MGLAIINTNIQSCDTECIFTIKYTSFMTLVVIIKFAGIKQIKLLHDIYHNLWAE